METQLAAMKRRAVLTLSLASLAAPARAQPAWPDRPVTMVVPAPPAGGTDLVARLYSDLLSQELGQQVIVDNKGGGNGNVGTAKELGRTSVEVAGRCSWRGC